MTHDELQHEREISFDAYEKRINALDESFSMGLISQAVFEDESTLALDSLKAYHAYIDAHEVTA